MPDYHMIHYIHEAPSALERTLDSNEPSIQHIAERARKGEIRRVIVSGVGSSYTAAMIAAPVFTRFCPLPVHIFPSTELTPYLPALVDQHTLVVAVSRSGERGWVVDSFREAVSRGAIGVAITGRTDDLLAQSAPEVLVTGEGPEISFPKTKSVVTCAGLLVRLALALANPLDPEAGSSPGISSQRSRRYPQDLGSVRASGAGAPSAHQRVPANAHRRHVGELWGCPRGRAEDARGERDHRGGERDGKYAAWAVGSRRRGVAGDSACGAIRPRVMRGDAQLGRENRSTPVGHHSTRRGTCKPMPSMSLRSR